MTFNRYYYDELTYLRDLGDVFARENPALAPFLTRESTDPDVERLLEAFAFLTGRLREKLDDEMPELAHSLLALLWPHYLRPVPSMAIVEFAPVLPTLSGHLHIPPDTFLDSRPIDGTKCRFRTVYPIELYPIRVDDAQLETTPTASQLTLRLRVADTADFPTLGVKALRFHLNTERDAPLGRALYLYIFRYLVSVTVTGDKQAEGFSLGPEAIKPVGLGEADAAIPYPPNAFPGFRLIQEYFLAPAKFLFFDLAGLGPSAALVRQRLTLTLRFSRPLEVSAAMDARFFRLNCTPAINLFPHDGQPVRIDHSRTEYRLRPGGNQADHFAIHSVEEVTGWRQGEKDRIVYWPFESFEHAFSRQGGAFYRLKRRSSVVGRGSDLFISFVAPAQARAATRSETVAFALQCTNGPLMDRVTAGLIDQPTSSSPSNTTFRNLGPATPPIDPPLEGDLVWRLIANLARNYASLLDVAALRTLLATYHFRAQTDRQAELHLRQMLDGILSIEAAPLDWIVRGIPLRGQEVRLTVSESRFGGEGEIFLFGAVFERFLSHYASLNACYRLCLIGADSNVVHRWPVRLGARTDL